VVVHMQDKDGICGLSKRSREMDLMAYAFGWKTHLLTMSVDFNRYKMI
jgi:hypothetical protein